MQRIFKYDKILDFIITPDKMYFDVRINKFCDCVIIYDYASYKL